MPEPAGVLRCRILNSTVALSSTDPAALVALGALFRGFPTGESGAEAASYGLTRESDDIWSVYAHGVPTYRCSGLAAALTALEWHVFSDLLAFRQDRVHLHGAALLAPHAATSVLILGASGCGKTTLTLALMTRGFRAYVDDVILIDPETLAPETLQRAFHVDEATRALVESLSMPPEWTFEDMPAGYFVPPRWAEHLAPVGAILFVAVDAQRPPALTRLSMADATSRLLSFSTTLDRAPELALSVAGRLTAQARAYALTAGGLDDTAALVCDAVERR